MHRITKTSDNDPICVEYMRKNLKPGAGKRLSIRKVNSLNLELNQNEQVDGIITDPPWGDFAIKSAECFDSDEFYRRMLDMFMRILKPDGVIGVLLSRDNPALALMSRESRLHKENEFDILVNGKKARLHVCKYLHVKQ